MMQKHDNKILSRRAFIGAAAGVAAFTIVPRHVLGGPGHVPPSEKLNIAAIGAGGRGSGDIDGVSSENIVALCDVDARRASKKYEEFPNAVKYSDYRVMLEKEQNNIDAVVVATPDHVHAPASMMAMKMGKHVYCEKPLTHTIHEARMMTETARKYKVATQMGNNGHSSESIRFVCEWIWSGAIGPVREVHTWSDRPIWPQGIDRPEEEHEVPETLDWDLWLGPAPVRPYNKIYAPFKWRGWWDFGTGALGDMGCHIIDAAFWALKLGHPTSIKAMTTPVNSETAPSASIIEYLFPPRADMPAVKLFWYDGGLKPTLPDELEANRKLSNNGLIFVGDEGKIVSGGYGSGARLIPESKMQGFQQPEKTIPRIEGGHHQDWIRACKGGKPACSNFDYAGPLTEMVLLGNLAIRAGRKLYWDGPNMRVTNYPEANQFVRCSYRDGWTL